MHGDGEEYNGRMHHHWDPQHQIMEPDSNSHSAQFRRVRAICFAEGGSRNIGSVVDDQMGSVCGEGGGASAALEVIHRKGLGETKHIQTGLLWIQQSAAEQRFKFHNVSGQLNPADLCATRLGEGANFKHTTTLGYEYVGGRAEEAPKLHRISRARHHEAQYSEDYGECGWLQCIIGGGRGTRKQQTRTS